MYHPLVKPNPSVWTAKRKWMGNIIPALFWLPAAAAGLTWMIVNSQILGLGLWLLVLSTVLGWIALNQFGFYQNGRMRRQLEKILRAGQGDLTQDRNFVGYASPKYAGMLDAHEDVGFLCFLPDRLRFVSETRMVEMSREQVKSVRFRANVHTMVGLGRWISVEGETDGKPIRLLIEPRDRGTMLGNLRMGKKLQSKIRRWLKETGPGPKSEAV